MTVAFVGATSFIVGAVVTYAATVYAAETEKAELASESLEEGFRTCIEHHSSLDRDGEAADELWQKTVSKKRTEKFAKDYAKR